ncbi:MAG TPA: hypothetical protein DC049_13385 [Spirochaetia bacterium]|nr:hypothetical protein [Spirochaetia bacterium]
MHSELPKTILLVEDEVMLALTEQKILESFGYNVITASSGEKAVKIFFDADNDFDLVLMDINLGSGMDGTETARIILEKTDIPVVFLSGYTDQETIARTGEITAYGYIVKNTGTIVLNESIKMAFRLYAAKKQLENNARCPVYTAANSSESGGATIHQHKSTENPAGRISAFIPCRPRFAPGLADLEKTTGDKDEIIAAIGNNISGMLYRLVRFPDGRRKFIWVSNQVESYYGIKPSEACKNAFLIYGKVHPGDRERLQNEEEEANRTLSVFKTETRMLTSDGKIRWSRFISVPHARADGSTVWDGLETDITEYKQMQEKIQNILSEKEILLKEVHHRMKNNMLTLYSLLNLHMNRISHPEAKSALQEAGSRLQSMQVLYEKLFISDTFNEISFASYINSLLKEITAVFPGSEKIRLILKIRDFTAGSRLLFPLGIILNEIISNAFKYALTGKQGELTVSASKNNGRIKIVIKDNGPGMPEISMETPGFGLLLVKMLSAQINAVIGFCNRGGTEFSISIPQGRV